VSTLGEVFLGVIAVATLAMAIVQVGVFHQEMTAGRGFLALVAVIFGRWKPLGVMGACLALGGADALELRLAEVRSTRRQLFADVAVRIDQALNSVQNSMGMPAREGRAILSGFKAALQALRDLRQNGRSRQSRSEDEDALFI
jgi:hypothetical protein